MMKRQSPRHSLLSFVIFAGALAITAPTLAKNTCDALYNAGIKSVQAPHHVTSTTTRRGGIPRTGEAIYSGGIEYLKLKGKWTRSSMTPKDRLEAAQEKLKTHPDTCTFLGDQTIDGEVVSVFKAHSNEYGTNQLVRVVKSSGLIQGGTMSLPDGATVETRYDYTNVRAPADVK
ncbi:MAG: hypothetical protein WBW61_08895 [Rhodanobacteraceae bacterium]